jgi:hypothetical protein
MQGSDLHPCAPGAAEWLAGRSEHKSGLTLILPAEWSEMTPQLLTAFPHLQQAGLPA